MFLNTKELYELTGYKYCNKQIEWLRNRGYKHEINQAGKPRVLKIYIEKLLGAGDDSTARQRSSSLEAPNFSALKRGGKRGLQ